MVGQRNFTQLMAEMLSYTFSSTSQTTSRIKMNHFILAALVASALIGASSANNENPCAMLLPHADAILNCGGTKGGTACKSKPYNIVSDSSENTCFD